jgi:hypothetical protein
VAHRRQELALGTARRLGLGAGEALRLVEPRPFERLRALIGHRLRERRLPRVGVPRLGPEEEQRAEHAPVGAHRAASSACASSGTKTSASRAG